MGYFSGIDMMEPHKTETEPSRVSRLEDWLYYLEDKLETLEEKRRKSRPSLYEDCFFGDSLPLYEYDDPDSVRDLETAIKQTKEKIEAEYDKNMKMLEWKLSVLLNGELPDGQLVLEGFAGPLAEAA